MSWKCPECSSENKDNWIRCFCGHEIGQELTEQSKVSITSENADVSLLPDQAGMTDAGDISQAIISPLEAKVVKTCAHCNKEIPADSIYCPLCGKWNCPQCSADHDRNVVRCGCSYEVTNYFETIEKPLPPQKAFMEKDEKIVAIDVRFPDGNIAEYRKLSELKRAVMEGKIKSSHEACIVPSNDKDKKKWLHIEKLPQLRHLYRPIWDKTVGYIGGGIIVGIIFKALDSTYSIFTLRGPEAGFAWLLVVASLLIKKPWLFIIAVIFAIKTAAGNLWLAAMATALVGAIFGTPAGMIVGTIAGHFKSKKAIKAPDASPEGSFPYISGIVVPVIALAILIPLWLWVSVKLLTIE